MLTTAIRDLRRALDDPARQPEWIETQHGNGYRFLKRVEERAVHPGRQSESTAEPEQNNAAKLRRAGAIALALFSLGVWAWQQRGEPETASEQIVAKSVVALPFKPIGEEARELASGLDEEIATTLARTPDIDLAGAAIIAEVADAGTAANQSGERLASGTSYRAACATRKVVCA